MKTIVVLLALVVAIVSENAGPIVEPEPVKGVARNDENRNTLEEDWQLVPDGDGNMYLIDVNHQPEPETRFNAWSDVVFNLFTRSNNNWPQIIQLNNGGQLSGSNFNPSHPTRFIIHGWNNDASSGVNQLLREQYLSNNNFNVIVVDWGAGANTINYFSARDRVDDVGAVVGEFIDFLNLNGMPYNTLTLVGHSLGAHAAGIAGKRTTRGTVQNIIGLDPAFPLFHFDNTWERIHHSDAVYVEIIHTDIGRLGFDQPLGDASFYPNWGTGQLGCGIDLAGTCGHSRAWEFFGESINSWLGFWGTPCDGFGNISGRNCPATGQRIRMGGEPVGAIARGVHYVATNSASPFAQG